MVECDRNNEDVPELESERQWLNDQGVLSPAKIAGAAGPREL